MRVIIRIGLFLAVASGSFVGECLAQDAAGHAEIRLPSPQRWPSAACTPEELARLRQAYRGAEPQHDVVARSVSLANEALNREVVFPPEGGQHNQWYQCDKCQLAVATIDTTHHRCPECGKVYSGYPYDNVIYGRMHQRLARDLSVCAWAYALTGNEKYARRARAILVGYAERYTNYPYHSANMGKLTDPPSRSGGHVFEQTLTEASWIGPVCEAYDLVRLSEVISEKDHRAIRESFLLKVSDNIAKHKAGKSNWQTYHNAAFIMIGGVLDRLDLVRQAIEDPKNGFYFQMMASVLPGGMWYENSWGYHFYTLGAVERIVETARRLGIDLYSTPQLKEMFSQGKEMAYDPGRARSQAYRLPVHKNWYRATTSHNTVLVDRTSQEGAEGRCESFLATPRLSAVAARTDTAYPGVFHRRLMVLRPGFLVVADLLTATDGKSHVFDWLYHNRGEGISSPVATRERAPPDGQGFEYLKDVRRGSSDELIRSIVSMNGTSVNVILNGEPSTEVLVGTGVGESVLDRVPLVFVTRKGRNARFAAAIDPVGNGESGEVETVELRNHETSGYVIRVQLQDGGEEIYAFDPAGAARSVAGLTTHSKLLGLRREKDRLFQVIAELPK